MEFTNTFTVPVSVDEAFAVLTDLERVAPCFPGATLEEVEGDTYRGRVKVKLGPMSLTYAGEATVARGDDGRSATIAASGREKRGSGTAAADVHASLEADGDATTVTVTTDLKITGKPAQFGRGVMGDVGAKIIDQFASCLQDELSASEAGSTSDDDATVAAAKAADDVLALTDAPSGRDRAPTDPATVGDAAVTAAGGAVATATRTEPDTIRVPEAGPRKVDVQPKVEALDLAEVAGSATAKRVVPVVVGLVAVLLVLRWLLGRGDPEVA